MPQAFTKILSLTLLSIFFFLGGACVASAQVTSTQSATTTQSQATMQNATSEGDRIMKLKDLACNPFPSGWFNSKDGTFAGCISQGVYYVFYIPLSWVMIAGAFVFDAMLTLSIDTKFIDQDFITKTWTIVRDFSNMLFIFILIYTGVQTILGMGKWAKTVLWVVVMALLINFSLFFTKVVIDAGNILAVGVYQAIAPVKTGLDKNLTDRPGGVPERNVSFVITRGFQPQSFIGKTASVQPLDAAIIFIVAGVVSAYAGYIFFKAAILFSLRLVVFWALMILSPFAFISMALPGKANKFESWLGALTDMTFVAPIFLFFIYIIMQVVNSGVLEKLVSPQSDGTVTMFTFDKILMPVIAASLIIKALQESLKFAEDFAGKAGGEFSGLVAGAMGMAGGAALGGVAGAGRKVIGGAAEKALESDRLQKLASSKNLLARGLGVTSLAQGGVLAANKAKDATFDVRNIGGAVGKGIGTLGFGKGGKLGYVKEEEEFLKNQKKQAALFDVSAKGKEKVQVEEKEAEIKNAEKTVGDLKKVSKSAAENATKAQAAVDAMRNSGKLDPGLNNILRVAKEEEAAAKKALEDAEKDLATIKVAKEDAEKALKDENERRRGVQAKQAALFHKPFSSAERKAIREKIRKGKTTKEKEEEDTSKLLEKLAKKLPKEEKSEEKKEEPSAH